MLVCAVFSQGVLCAQEEALELDLLQVPDLARNKIFRKALATLAPVVDIEDVRTEGDWLVVQVRPRPSGLPAAARGALS